MVTWREVCIYLSRRVSSDFFFSPFYSPLLPFPWEKNGVSLDFNPDCHSFESRVFVQSEFSSQEGNLASKRERQRRKVIIFRSMFHFKTRKDASSNFAQPNYLQFKLESNVPRFILDPSAIWRGSSCKVPVTRESRPSIHDTYVLPPRDPERIRRVARRP